MRVVQGAHEVYQRQTGAVSARRGGEGALRESTPVTSVAQGDSDQVNISSEGTFRAQLEKYGRTYAAQGSQPTSAQRLEELKAQYQGDNCPICGKDVATAILARVRAVPMEAYDALTEGGAL